MTNKTLLLAFAAVVFAFVDTHAVAQDTERMRSEDLMRPDPLRYAAPRLLDRRPEDRSRSGDMGLLAAASRLGQTVNVRFLAEDAERAILALERATREGTSYDLLVMMLGIRQVERYSATPVRGGGPNGSAGPDNARALARVIALAAGRAPSRTLTELICTDQDFCDPTPVGEEELGAVISPSVRPGAGMNPHRGFILTTGMAAVMSYIATMESPEIGLNPGETPEQLLAGDRAARPEIDVVAANRALVRACIRQPVPCPDADLQDFPLDLGDCALAGARAAIYNIADNGVQFEETENPLYLARLNNEAGASVARAGPPFCA